MQVAQAKNILSNHKNDLAFLIGNGINLHYKNDNLSWKDLLLTLWSRHASELQSSIPEGITFTEFYDALEILNIRKENFGAILQKEVQQKMKLWQPDHKQNLILNRIKGLDAPILTTNFDWLIAQSMGLTLNRFKNGSFTDYYPWSCYYSDRKLANPAAGFGVWHPNGMLKYHRSIKLGLAQYMGNVERARKMINDNPSLIGKSLKRGPYWPGHDTWLHIVFNKSLFIFGLGLDETEVFIRWLLIERAKYFRRYPKRKKAGWYVMKKNEKDRNLEGKKFFLKSVGFEVIELDNYTDLYENIWK